VGIHDSLRVTLVQVRWDTKQAVERGSDDREERRDTKNPGLHHSSRRKP
jgi:hypothetical protein